MTTWVKKDGEYKEIQTEDISFYTRRGWEKSEKPTVTEAPKKGRRRTFDEAEISETEE